MTVTRRNVMWPLIVIVIGSIWLLMVAGAFPPAVGDVLQRAWPALLILFGIDVLVAQRRFVVAGRAISLSYVGLVVLVLVLAGVVWIAYRQQADVLRDDIVVPFEASVPADVTQLQIAIDLERTSVEIVVASDASRQITADFAGSAESEVDIGLSPEGVLRIVENYQHSIPKLEDMGRGTLSLTVPVDVPISQVVLANAEGDVALELRPALGADLGMAVDVQVGTGDLTFDIPDQAAVVGELHVDEGDLTLNVPLGVALTLNRGSGSGTPRYSYNPDRYDLLATGQLELDNVQEFNVALELWMDNGAALTVRDVE